MLGPNKFKKYTTRGGGPLPHGDPPDFKFYENSRYIGFNDALLWVKNFNSREYAINLKHNQYRGIKGFMMSIFRNHVMKMWVPIAIICYLKSISQDTANYYRKELSCIEGDNKVHGNLKEYSDSIKLWINEGAQEDFLGRRSIEFYGMGSLKFNKNYKNYDQEYIKSKPLNK